MSRPTLDEALRASNPWNGSADSGLTAEVARVVRQTARDASPAPRRLLKWWLFPAIGLGGLALTAGAHQAVFPDVPIKIDYVTDTGTAVSCTALVSGGSIFDSHSDSVVGYYHGRDMQGIGQKVYEHALVLAGDTTATADNTPKSDTWAPELGTGIEDEHFAFNMSLVDYLIINTQIDLHLDGNDGSVMSDCSGQLH